MTKSDTYFLYDEKTFWHTTRDAVLFLPPSETLQPLTSLGHMENAETKRRFLSLVITSGLADELLTEKVNPISYQQANLIHTKQHLDNLIELSKGQGGEAGYGAPFGYKGYDYACISAGLATKALQLVLAHKNTNAYALTRPPGHHAVTEQGMGFCLMANIAIAIAVAKQTNPDLRIAVVDWDVHHGNGTQDIFYNRSDVLTISLHQDTLFPRTSGAYDEYGSGDGENYNINIPLPAGTGNGGYIYAMEQIVTPAIKKFNPDVIIVASGYDASAKDPVGRMMLSASGFAQMTDIIVDVAKTINAPIAMTHEGGFCPVYTAICAQKTLESLAGSTVNINDDFEAGFTGLAGIELQNWQKQHIDELKQANKFI